MTTGNKVLEQASALQSAALTSGGLSHLKRQIMEGNMYVHLCRKDILGIKQRLNMFNSLKLKNTDFRNFPFYFLKFPFIM